jgi:hypothetical protein
LKIKSHKHDPDYCNINVVDGDLAYRLRVWSDSEWVQCSTDDGDCFSGSFSELVKYKLLKNQPESKVFFIPEKVVKYIAWEMGW